MLLRYSNEDGLRSVFQEQDLLVRVTERYSGPTRYVDIQVAQLVTRSLGYQTTGTSKVVMSVTRSNKGMGIPTIRSRTL